MPPHPPPRSHRPHAEREARSRLVKRCADRPLLRGSLVTMRRSCGKAGCRCKEGQLHVSLYLAVRVGQRRKMIYVPAELEAQVREWVASSQEVERLLEIVSQSCLEQLLTSKREQAGPRRARRPRKD